MGLLGWDVIRDNVTLVGILQSHSYSGGGRPFDFFDDYDSNLEILPAPGFEGLAVNRAGVKNPGGIIECEIHVARNIALGGAEGPLFDHLVGRTITLAGAFVEDKSHNNRTEIHPITSLVADMGTDATGRQVIFYAFCDDWHFCPPQPTQVPFSQTDRVASALIPFPPPPADPRASPMYTTTLWPVSSYASEDAQLIRKPDGSASLSVTVHTGIAAAGQGLFWGKFTLWWMLPKGKDKEGKDKEHHPKENSIEKTSAIEKQTDTSWLQEVNGSPVSGHKRVFIGPEQRPETT